MNEIPRPAIVVADNLKYETDPEHGTAELTGSFGKVNDDLSIPESIIYHSNTYRVTAIRNRALAGREIKSLRIPSSVSVIGEWAFSNCKRLTSIILPDSLIRIGEGCFYRCHYLKTVKLSASNNNSAPENIPNAEKIIDDMAFAYCSELRTIEIPSSITGIGEDAFLKCKWLTTIYLPSSVTTIGDYAFYGCKRLENVFLPTQLTNIGEHVFRRCTNLKRIAIPASVNIGLGAFGGDIVSYVFESKNPDCMDYHSK